jgi:hypothetical protein
MDRFQANPEGRWRFGRFSALLAPYIRISVCSSLGSLKIGQIADVGISPARRHPKHCDCDEPEFNAIDFEFFVVKKGSLETANIVLNC